MRGSIVEYIGEESQRRYKEWTAHEVEHIIEETRKMVQYEKIIARPD